MKEIKNMTKKELSNEFIATDEMINVICCYGTSDLRYLDALRNEIDRRGYQILTSVRIE